MAIATDDTDTNDQSKYTPIHFTQLTESVIRAIYIDIITAVPSPTDLPTTNTNLYDDSVSYTVIDITDIPKTENINLLSVRPGGEFTNELEPNTVRAYGYKIDVNRYVFCHADKKDQSEDYEYKLIEGSFNFKSGDNDDIEFVIDNNSFAFFSNTATNIDLTNNIHIIL